MSEPPEKVRQVVADWIAAGKPAQPAMAWPKDRWLEAFPARAADLYELPDELDRETVAWACEHAALSPENAVFGFLVVMAWGYGEKAYGPHRATNILNARPDADRRLQAIAQALVDGGAMAGYRALSGDACLPGLKVSFGTKVLYFFQPPEQRPRALILDDFVASWLRRELGWKIDSKAWSVEAYEHYIETLDGWWVDLGIHADEIEMVIFQAEATRRGSRWGVSEAARARAVAQWGDPAQARASILTDSLPFSSYPGGGRSLLGKPRQGDGTARHGYGVEALRWAGFRCAYCGLDMSRFEGWLQLSIDHVIAQQMQGAGYPPDWVLDAANVVACCRACNDLFNRDPVIGEIPATLDAFFDLRDRVFRERRERIGERRAAERSWFDAHIEPKEPE